MTTLLLPPSDDTLSAILARAEELLLEVSGYRFDVVLYEPPLIRVFDRWGFLMCFEEVGREENIGG